MTDQVLHMSECEVKFMSNILVAVTYKHGSLLPSNDIKNPIW